MGANEYGVTIGNEAVYTKEKYKKQGGLLGMDLLRLALERSKTAQEALEIIIDLLELYGQGGNAGYNGHEYYQNSFIIADKAEAWVLETADKLWIAEKVKDIRAISNTITIRGKGDLHHPDLITNAIENGWCKDPEKFDFYEVYVDKFKLEQIFAYGNNRISCSMSILSENLGNIDEQTMMQILRNHTPEKNNWNPVKDASMKSICVHAKNILNPAQSTISMVSVIGEPIQTHWITGSSAPCTSVFKPVFLPGGMPKIGTKATKFYDKNNIWWKHEELHRLVLMDYNNRLDNFREERDALEKKFIEETRKLFNEILAEEIKNKKIEELSRVLKEFTKKKFSETMLKEDLWIERVSSMEIQNKQNFAYRRFWQKLNKQNKMPFIKMKHNFLR